MTFHASLESHFDALQSCYLKVASCRKVSLSYCFKLEGLTHSTRLVIKSTNPAVAKHLLTSYQPVKEIYELNHKTNNEVIHSCKQQSLTI